MNSGIYEIRNKVNGKQYIGRSKKLNKRLYNHKNLLVNNSHYNVHLQRAWNKYGGDNFKFGLLMKCREQIIVFVEQYWIDKLNSYREGYNRRKDAREGGVSGEDASNWKGGKDTVECDYCGNVFKVYPSENNKYNFCKRKCFNNYQKEINFRSGKSLSEKTKNRISKGQNDKRGENGPNANLTKNEVKEIKRLLKKGNLTYKDIANKFNTSTANINAIQQERSWTHIKID